MNRLISFILVIFMLGEYPVTLLMAQDLNDAALWDRSVLEQYLDQADRQHSYGEWHRYAEMGILAAIAGWEQDALYKEAEQKLRHITELRFAEYVVARSIQKNETVGNDQFLQAVSDANIAYLYEHNADGSILLDENNHPVFKRIDGLFDSNNKTGEYTLWKNTIQAAQKKALEEWYENAQAGIPELTNLSETQTKLISEMYQTSIDEHAAHIKAEIDRLYAIEESRFLSYRIYDHRSLEYETRQQTAAYVASALVTETEQKLQDGMDSLQARLDLMAQTDNRQPGIEEGMSWQENFRQMMEKGFAAWDEAEEKLLMERIAWEQDAGQKLFEAEEAWAKAFDQFSVKRGEWESKITRLIENGSELWRDLLDQNEGTVILAIENAKAELTQNKKNRVASVQSRIENLTGMLLESIQMIKSARDSWEYLMDTGDDGELGNSDYASVALTSEAMRNSTFEVYFNLLPDNHPIKQYGDSLLAIVQEGANWRYNILNDGGSVYHSRLDTYLDSLVFSLDDSSLGAINYDGVPIHGDFISGFTRGFESQTDYESHLFFLQNQLALQIAELEHVKERLEDNAIEAGNKAEDEYRASIKPTGQYSVSWSYPPPEAFEARNKAGYDAYIAVDTTVLEQEKRINAIKAMYEQYRLSIDQLVGFFKWVFEGQEDEQKVVLSTDETIIQLSNTGLPSRSSELNEALNWCDSILPKYVNYAMQAQNSLAGQYGIVISDDVSVQNTSYFNTDGSLSEALSLSDDPHAWENLYLDEYQVELLKAQAYGQYYDNLVSVSSAVMAYAEESSSSKVDASITEQEYTNTEKAYLSALETYNTALGKLQLLSGNIAEMQSDIDTVRTEIQDAQSRLKDIQQELTSFIIDVYNGDPEGMKDVLQSQYRQYLGLIGLDPKSDKTLGIAMADYLTALNDFSQKQQYGLLSNKLKDLMFGSEAYVSELQNGDETLSLIELEVRLEKAESFIPGYYTDVSEPIDSASFVSFFTFVNNELLLNLELDKNSYSGFAAYIDHQLGISPSHAYYSRFIKLFTDFTSIEPDSSSRSDEREQMDIVFEMQELVDDIKGQYAHAYALRIRELQFLQAPSLHAFVRAIGWDASEYRGKTESELYTYIVDQEYTPGITITDIKTEIDTDILSLQNLLTFIPTGDADTHPLLNIRPNGSLHISDADRKCMFFYSLLDHFNNDYKKVAKDIAARIEALESLQNTISRADSVSHISVQNELRIPTYTESREHLFLRSYLQGLNAFSVGGKSFAAHEYVLENQGLSELVKHGIMYNPALSSAAAQLGREKLETLLLDNGLLQITFNASGEQIRSFTHPSEIVKNIQTEANSVLDALAILEELQRRYTEFSNLLDPGVNTAVSGYFDALTEELACVYAESTLEESLSSESLNRKLEKRGNQMKALNNHTQSISKRLMCQYLDTDDSESGNSYISLKGQIIAHLSYDILENYFDKDNSMAIDNLINEAFNADYLLAYSEDLRLQVLKNAVTERVGELQVATEVLAKGGTVTSSEISGITDKELRGAISSLDFVVYDPESFYESISYNSITKKAYVFDALYGVQYLQDLLVSVQAVVEKAAADPDTPAVTFSGDGQAIMEQIISMNTAAGSQFHGDLTRVKRAENFLQSIFTSYSTDITFDTIMRKIEESVDSLVQSPRKMLNTSLSNPEVYRDLFGAALSDYIFEKQYDSSFAEYVCDVFGIASANLPEGLKSSQRDIESLIYQNNNAEKFYIKQRLLEGEELADIKLVNTALLPELQRFEALIEIQQTYLEVAHGDLYAFIESAYNSFAGDYEFYLDAKARISSRESVTPYDSYSIAVSNGGYDRSANKLSVLKALQEREIGGDASSRSGGTYSKTAALLDELNGEMKSEYETLAGDQISRRLRALFYGYHRNARKVLGYEGEEYIQENWTYYLTDNYLLNEQERIKSEAQGDNYVYTDDALYAHVIDDSDTGYINDITIDNDEPDGTIDLYDGFSNTGLESLSMHGRPGDEVSRKDRYLYDLGLRVLEQAAFLTQALECSRPLEDVLFWHIGSQSNSDHESITAEAIYERARNAKKEDYNYTYDTHLKDTYEKASQNLQTTQYQLNKLRKSIASRGARIAVIEASLKNSDNNLEENKIIAKKMSDLRNKLNDVREEIAGYQNKWNILINGDGTDKLDSYSSLLSKYENQYNITEAAFDKLESVKWELKRKEAVMEYATAGYLSYNDPLLNETESIEGYEFTDEQLESREALKKQISAVNISTLHERYSDKQNRAHAVIDVLSELSKKNGTRETTVSSTSLKSEAHSQSYLAYYNRYMQHLKERILLDKMNNLVLKQIAMQETKVQKAYQDWIGAKTDMFGMYDFTSAFTVEDFALLEQNYTSLSDEDALTVDSIYRVFGNETVSSDYERLEEYFTISTSYLDSDIPSYQKDLDSFIDQMNTYNHADRQNLIGNFTFAMQYEAFLEALKKDDLLNKYSDMNFKDFWTSCIEDKSDSKVKDFFAAYLRGNRNEWGDDIGAREHLVLRMKEGFDYISTKDSSSGQDKTELYSLFKLISGTSSMTVSAGFSGQTGTATQADYESYLGTELVNREFQESVIESADNYRRRETVLWIAAAAIGWMWWMAPVTALFIGLALDAHHNANIRYDEADLIYNRFVHPNQENRDTYSNVLSDNMSSIKNTYTSYCEEMKTLQMLKGARVQNWVADEVIVPDTYLNTSGDTPAEPVLFELMLNSIKTAYDTATNDSVNLEDDLKALGYDESDGSALNSFLNAYKKETESETINALTSGAGYLSKLVETGRNVAEQSARDFDSYLVDGDGTDDKSLIQKQTDAIAAFKEALNAFNAYKSDQQDSDDYIRLKELLTSAAEKAFIQPAFSRREHNMLMYEGLRNIFTPIAEDLFISSGVKEELIEEQKKYLIGRYNKNDSSAVYNASILGDRYDAFFNVKSTHFDIVLQEYQDQMNRWEMSMKAILARGQLEWSDAERRLRREYNNWLIEAQDGYNDTKRAWDDKYLAFLDEKSSWLNTVSVQSTQMGNMDVLHNFGDAAAAAICMAEEAAQAVVLPELDSLLEADPDKILESTVGESFSLLDSLMENATFITGRIDFYKPVIFSDFSAEQLTSVEAMNAIREFQTDANNGYSKSIIALELERIADRIQAAEAGFEKQIVSANKGVKNQIRHTLAEDGYVLSGSNWTRTGVTGSNIIDGLETEIFSIRDYSDFEIPDINFSDSFNRIATLDSHTITTSDLSVDALEDIMAKVMHDISDETERIFGKVQDDDNGELFDSLDMFIADEDSLVGHYVDSENDDVDGWKGDTPKPESKFLQFFEWTEEIVEVTTKRNKNAHGRGSESATITTTNVTEEKHKEIREVFLQPGEFGTHVGFAPEFKDAPDMNKSWEQNIKFKGLGEMGHIMGRFIWNKIKEGIGYAEADKPFYEQPLWDDRETWVEAPSVRGVIDISTSIAATVVGAVVSCIATPVAGAAICAAINATDDAIFTALDVGYGEKEWDEAWINYGIQTGASFGASMLSAGIAGGATGNVAKDAVFSATKSYVSNGLIAPVRALQYSRDEGITMNADSIIDSMFSVNALANTAGAFAQSAVGSGLGNFFSQDGKFAEGLAGIGTDLAVTGAKYSAYLGAEYINGWNEDSFRNAFDDMGGLSFNILNVGSLIDIAYTSGISHQNGYAGNEATYAALNSLKGVGLFELNINSKGISGRIGLGGMNLAGNLFSLGKGRYMKQRIRDYIRSGNAPDGVTVEALIQGYAQGDRAFEDTLWRLASGKDTLALGKAPAVPKPVFNPNTGRIETQLSPLAQTIADSLGNRTIHLFSNAFGSDSDLATVLSHESWRNGIDDGIHNQIIETRNAAKAHIKFAAALQKAYGDGINLNSLFAAEADMYNDAMQTGRMSMIDRYIDSMYDSSKDYWRLMFDAEGNMFLEDDGFEDLFDAEGNLLVAANEATANAYARYMRAKDSGASGSALDDLYTNYLNSKTITNNDGWALDRIFHKLAGNVSNNSNDDFETSEQRAAYELIAAQMILDGKLTNAYTFIDSKMKTLYNGENYGDPLRININGMWDHIDGIDRYPLLGQIRQDIFVKEAMNMVNTHAVANLGGSELSSDQRISALRNIYTDQDITSKRLDNFSEQYANFLVGHDIFDDDFTPAYQYARLGATRNTYSTKYKQGELLLNFHTGGDIGLPGFNNDFGKNIYAMFSGIIDPGFVENVRTGYSSAEELEAARKANKKSSYYANHSNELPSSYPFKFALDSNSNIVTMKAGFYFTEGKHSTFAYTGLEIRTMHHWDVKVRANQFAKANTVIGTLGSTGYSDGTHLHLDFRTLTGTTTFMDWLIDPNDDLYDEPGVYFKTRPYYASAWDKDGNATAYSQGSYEYYGYEEIYEYLRRRTNEARDFY